MKYIFIASNVTKAKRGVNCMHLYLIDRIKIKLHKSMINFFKFETPSFSLDIYINKIKQS